ncbi:nucleobindin-2-like isoform X3 [Littorina saxatilis]|uniref:nucleobindin-2-like isoform X3 n=1 Tax=Littorina saxatilis TaxID=31220 RepID=UPI0038B450D3
MTMAFKTIVSIVTLSVMLQLAACKPVVDKRGPPPPTPVEGGSPDEDAAAGLDKESVSENGTGLEYDRYLRQVVDVLESDDEFRKKLQNANISDIKSGAIALHLELVNNTIRTKLDEIKRMEVQRLQELARIKMKSMSGTEVLHFIAAHGGVNRMDIPTHLDVRNPHSFEMKDLETLIKKTTNDLEELDKQRKEEFKTYEMEKEFEYREKLKTLPDEDKKKEEQHHKELKEKHQQHEKINHPGSKDQFEEVWEKEDHLDQDFDPKTFFMMHDLNGDRMWDIQEVEAVLQRELDKVYDAKNSPDEDDPIERFEEMNRMREHVFTEIDQNKDLMITMDEFITYTGKHGENDKFKEDEGWETVDEKPEFTDEELQEYIRQNHAQPHGVVPPPVDPSLHFSPEEQLRQQQQMLHQQGMGQQGMPQQGIPQQQAGGVPQQQQLNQQLNQQQLNQQQLHQQQLNQQQLNQQQLNQQQLHQQQQVNQQQQLNAQQQQQQQQQLNQVNQGQPVQGQVQPVQGQGQPVQGQHPVV